MKISDTDIKNIFFDYSAGLSGQQIAIKYNISKSYVHGILSKEKRKSIPIEIEKTTLELSILDPDLRVASLLEIGFPKYTIDTFGNIVSFKQNKNGRKLKPFTVKGGYQVIGIKNFLNERVYRTVHSLVTSAFIGPTPNGMEICHLNGNPKDNRLTNLKFDTPSKNCRTRRYANRPSCV